MNGDNKSKKYKAKQKYATSYNTRRMLCYCCRLCKKDCATHADLTHDYINNDDENIFRILEPINIPNSIQSAVSAPTGTTGCTDKNKILSTP